MAARASKMLVVLDVSRVPVSRREPFTAIEQ